MTPGVPSKRTSRIFIPKVVICIKSSSLLRYWFSATHCSTPSWRSEHVKQPSPALAATVLRLVRKKVHIDVNDTGWLHPWQLGSAAVDGSVARKSGIVVIL